MKTAKTLQIVTFLMLSAAGLMADRGMGELRTATPQGASPEQIIQKFAAKEQEFKQARDHYTFRQKVLVQTVDEDKNVDGEFQQVSDIVFDDHGKRTENVVFAPQSTLARIGMTREDFEDIQNRIPFVLTTDDLAQYQINYVGQQKIDELDTYVFDVAPKLIEKGKRYFQGRIWVDSQDYQIVVTDGRNVPDVHAKRGKTENLSPKFTTYREQIDCKYWFPTYTIADDVLHFSNEDVHIRETVKYTNYQRYGSQSKIIFEGEVPEGTPQPTKSPRK